MWIKKFRLFNDDLNAGGGGGDAGTTTVDTPSPSPAPAPSEPSFDIAKASESIADSLGFGKDESKSAETDPAVVKEDPAAAPPSVPAAPTPAPVASPGKFTADAPPTTWTPAASAKWQSLDPEVRAEIAKRENNMFAGIEQYRNGHNFGKAMADALGPAMPLLQESGMMPDQFVKNLTQADLTLRSPTIPMADKLAYAQSLLKGYGIDIAAVAGGAQVPADAPYVDPQVAGLQQKIQELTSRIDGRDTQEQSKARAEQLTKIEAFAADAAHPHFMEVADDVALLIRGSGGKMPLAEAYEKAVFANPVTRAKEVSRLHAEVTAKAAKENAERVAAAKKASGANVRTSGHQGTSTGPKGSMDDTLAATMAAIKSRN